MKNRIEGNSDWSHFRGNPQLSGVSPDQGPVEGKISWKAALGRQWYSAPLVCDDRILLACPGRLGRKMMAVDWSNGEVLWEASEVPERLRMSSPLIQGGKDGKSVWARPFNYDGMFQISTEDGSVISEVNGLGVLDYRTHPQPVLAGDDRYLLLPRGTRSHTREDPTRTDTGIWDTLVCVDPHSDEIRWQLTTGQFFGAPIVVNGTAICATYDGQVFGIDPVAKEIDSSVIGVAAERRVLWHYHLGSRVTCSPVQMGEQVIIPSEDGTVLCLNAASGEKVWSVPIRQADDQLFQIWSTPVVYNDHIYLTGSDGILHIIDSAGQVQRRIELGIPVRSRVIVSEDTVYVAGIDGGLLAVSLAEGKQLWQVPTGPWMVTAPLSLAGENVLLLITNDMVLHAFSTSDGKELWSVVMVDYPEDWVAFDEFQASPQVSGNTVVVGSPGHMVTALDKTNGTRLWRKELGGEIPSDPVILDGKILVGQQGGTDEYLCLDLENGEEIWNQRLGRVWAAANGLPGSGKVFVAGAQGEAFCLSLETGSIIWKTRMGSDLYLAPLISQEHGIVIFGAWNQWLWALDMETGVCRWRRHLGTYLDSGACAMRDGMLYVPTMGPRFFCLDVADGSELWKVEDESWWTSNASPAVTEDHVYIMVFTDGSFPKNPYAIETQCRNRQNGELLWRYPVGGLNGPTVAGDTLYFASTIRGDFALYALYIDPDAQERVRFRVELGYNVLESTIAVSEGMVYAYAEDGYLYAVC